MVVTLMISSLTALLAILPFGMPLAAEAQPTGSVFSPALLARADQLIR